MLKITKCLRDTCELVRRQTFILLSRLLQVNFYHITVSLHFPLLKICYKAIVLLNFNSFIQRDYVKWRGVLFLRFLLCLVDDSEKIRQLADFLFGNILKGYNFI